MPKKLDKSAEDTASVELLAFQYPSIGDGITVKAKNQAEADQIAEKLRASLPPVTLGQ